MVPILFQWMWWLLVPNEVFAWTLFPRHLYPTRKHEDNHLMAMLHPNHLLVVHHGREV
jgi:hypothetical protein